MSTVVLPQRFVGDTNTMNGERWPPGVCPKQHGRKIFDRVMLRGPRRPWSGSDCLIESLGSPQSSETVMSTSSFIDTTFFLNDRIAVRNFIAAYLGVEAQRVSDQV